jgi:glycosyltransferase involved in cell wall biosynthesis
LNDAILSLVLPVHNHAAALVPVVEQCLGFIRQNSIEHKSNEPHESHELIIVDDGSDDDTPLIADKLAANHDPIMVLHHPKEYGYGRAVMRGWEAARGDYVMLVDAESLTVVQEARQVLPFLGMYDVIIGYRLAEHTLWYRNMHERFWRNLLNNTLHLGMRDSGSHLALFRTGLREQLRCTSKSPFIIPELYARAKKQNLSSIQIGIKSYQRPRNLPGNIYPHLHFGSLWELLMFRLLER